MTTQLSVLPAINRNLFQVLDQNYFGLVAYGCRFGFYVFDFRILPPIVLDDKYVHNAHRGKVLSISFCKVKNYNFIASIGEDKFLKIWDLDNCSCVAELGITECARVVEWLHGSTDSVSFPDVYGCIAKWNFKTNKVIKIKTGSDVKAIILSSNYMANEFLAVGHSSGAVSVINVVTHVPVHKLRGHTMEISSLAWSQILPDVLCTTSSDQTARLWKLGEDNATKIYHYPFSKYKSEDRKNVKISAICHPQDSDVIICSNVRGEFGHVSFKEKAPKLTSYSTKSWDLNCKMATVIQPYFDKSLKVTESLFLACDNFKLSVWNISTQRAVLAFPFLMGHVYDLKLSSLQPNLLAVCSGDGIMKIWNQNSIENREEISTIYVHSRVKIMTAAWHPVEEHILAYGVDEGRVGIIDILKKKSLYSFETHHSGAVYSMQWGPCSKMKDSSEDKLYLYSAGGGVIRVHEINNYKEDSPNFDSMIELPANLETVSNQRSELCWNFDYSCLAIGSYKGYIDLFDNDLKFLGRIIVQIKSIENLRWHPMVTIASPSGSPYKTWIAVAGNDENIHIIDSIDIQSEHALCKSMKILSGHKKKLSSICWSHHMDGFLVSGSKDGTVQVWNVATNSPIANYPWHRDMVHAVCWSATDPDVIFSGGGDGSVRIWKISEQTETVPSSKSIVIKNKPKLKQNVPTVKKNTPLVSEPSEPSSESERLQNVPSENEITCPNSKALESCTENRVKEKNSAKLFDPECTHSLKKNGNLQPVLLRKYSKEESLETVFKIVDYLLMDNKDEPSEGIVNNLSPEDVEKIGLFGDQSSVLTFLRNKAQSNEGNIKSWYLNLMSGNIKPMIIEAANTKKLNEFLVAVSPSVSFEFWHEVCEKYAIQLVEEEQYVRSSLYFTLCGKLKEGLNLLTVQGKIFEALALARARLPDNDPMLQNILCKAHKYFISQRQIENQAACYLAMREPLQAAKTLYVAADSRYIYAAVYICCKFNLKEEAEAYAYFCMEKCLSQNDYQTFYSLIKLVEDLKVYTALIRVHELLTNYFKEWKKDDGLLAKHLLDVTESRCQIWSGRLCGDTHESFLAYAYNTLVKEDIIHPADKEYATQLYQALDYMVIKRKKMNESAEAHICIAIWTTQAIVSLLQDDFDCVSHFLQKVFATSHNVAFLPKVVSWLFMPLDIHFEAGCFICDIKVLDIELNVNYQMFYKSICDSIMQTKESSLVISPSSCDMSCDLDDKVVDVVAELSKKDTIDGILLFFFFSYLDELKRLVKKGYKFKCYEKMNGVKDNSTPNCDSLVSEVGCGQQKLKPNNETEEELELQKLIKVALKEAEEKEQMILKNCKLAEEDHKGISSEDEIVTVEHHDPELFEFVQSIVREAETRVTCVLESQNTTAEQNELNGSNSDLENGKIDQKNVHLIEKEISENETGEKSVKENSSEIKIDQGNSKVSITETAINNISTKELENELHIHCWTDINLTFSLTNVLNNFLCKKEYAMLHYLEKYLEYIDFAISTLMKKQSQTKTFANVPKKNRNTANNKISAEGYVKMCQTSFKVAKDYLVPIEKNTIKFNDAASLTDNSKVPVSELKTLEETADKNVDEAVIFINKLASTIVQNNSSSVDKTVNSLEIGEEVTQQNLYKTSADCSHLCQDENIFSSEKSVACSLDTDLKDIKSNGLDTPDENLNALIDYKECNTLNVDSSTKDCEKIKSASHEETSKDVSDQAEKESTVKVQNENIDSEIETSSVKVEEPILQMSNGVDEDLKVTEVNLKGEILTLEDLKLKREKFSNRINLVKSVGFTYPNPFDAVCNILCICCDIVHKHPCEIVREKFHEIAHQVLMWKEVYSLEDERLVCEICKL